MKQHITEEQAKEITHDQWLVIFKFITKSVDVRGGLKLWYPLSIGQMIEFLGDGLTIEHDITGNSDDRHYEWFVRMNGNDDDNSSGIEIELCDALWSAVKEVLEMV